MLGFSGTRRDLTHPQQAVVTDFLEGLGDWDGFVTGGCVGVDHLVGWYLVHVFPQKRHVVVVPADRSRVAAWWRRVDTGAQVEVVEMPPGTSYEARNQRIVDLAACLAAFPEYPELHRRSQRSGTWQTVRKARRNHLVGPVVMPLSTFAGTP